MVVLSLAKGEGSLGVPLTAPSGTETQACRQPGTNCSRSCLPHEQVEWMDRQRAQGQAVEAWLSPVDPHQAWAASFLWGREVGGDGESHCGVLVPMAPQQTGGGQFSNRDLVRSPTHAGHLLNQRVPGRAGGGPQRACSRPQSGQAWGLPVKLTWGGLQLRVVSALKQAHTHTYTHGEHRMMG